MPKGKGSLAVAGCAAILSACLPETFTNDEELDAILTVRQPSHDFSSYETYSMSNELIDLGFLVDEPREIPDWASPVVSKAVADEMAALGCRRVPYEERSDNADVVVLLGAVVADNWVLSGYYPWWPGYWFWYPVVRPVNFVTGSLVVTMLHPEDAVEDESGRLVVPAVWAAGMSGVASGSQQRGTRRLQSSIRQAFAQSPYLRTGEAQAPAYDAGPMFDAGSTGEDGASFDDRQTERALAEGGLSR